MRIAKRIEPGKACTDDEIIVRKTVIGGKRWRDDYTVICVHATTRPAFNSCGRYPVMSLTCCLGRAARLAMSHLMDGLISASDAQRRDLAIMSVVGTFRNISKRLVIELPRCPCAIGAANRDIPTSQIRRH